MRFRVRSDISLSDEEEAKAVVKELQSHIGKKMVGSLYEEQSFIDFHKCYHDEPTPKACEPIEHLKLSEAIQWSQIVTNDGLYNSHGDITLLDNGELYMVYGKGSSHAWVDIKIVGRRGVIGEDTVTWGKEDIILEKTLDYRLEEPQISVGSDGTVYLTVWLRQVDGGYDIAHGLGIIKSTDNCYSWSSVVRPFIQNAHSRSPSRIVELDDGSLQLSYSYKYAGDVSNPLVKFSGYTMTSLDKAETWIYQRKIIDGKLTNAGETGFVYLGGDELFCVCRGLITEDKYMQGVWSYDRGVSWTKPVPVYIGSGLPKVTLLPDGKLITVYRRYNLDPLKMFNVCRTSEDKGHTWSEEIILDGLSCGMVGGAIGVGSDTYVAHYPEVIFHQEAGALPHNCQARVSKLIFE